MKKIIYLLLIGTSLMAQTPKDWFHQSSSDAFYSTHMNEAYEQVLNGKTSSPVIVAIIDSGVDAEHEDLKDNMWVNYGEIPGNNKDDDNNGYVDDIHGWNFIGGPNGNVNEDTYEVTRLYKSLLYKYENANEKLLNKDQKAEFKKFKEYQKAVNAQLKAAEKSIAQIKESKKVVSTSFDAVIGAVGADPSQAELDSLVGTGNQELMMGVSVIANAKQQIGDFKNLKDLKGKVLNEVSGGLNYYQGKLDYAYNPDFNPRDIVGDNINDVTEKYYGNNDVEGPDALHGTHVAGIVGAVRGNGIGMDGVCNNVKIMSVRAVPNGDERDKDVANSIRYAVDNGASIINMSFGKGYSPNKKAVDDAIKYAVKNDVLIVHAAGNGSQNNDKNNNFPNDVYKKKRLFGKKSADTYITVGALNYVANKNMVAPFSNYGKKTVDIFSPGMKIYSTVPDDKYRNLQGTSMAAPVLAGVAATIRSYYPQLSAKQVKEILYASSTKVMKDVVIPGEDGETSSFKELSTSGGVVNALEAAKLADKTKGKRKKKFIKNTMVPQA